MGDFDDVLTVQNQASKPLLVPLLGRRPPPILTRNLFQYFSNVPFAISVPATIDVGECLIGGTLVTHVTVKNEGGAGRFCIMDKAVWPASNFKVTILSIILW